MNRRTITLKTAILVAVLCLFGVGRVAYAAHQCYQLTTAGCGAGIERAVEPKHGQLQDAGTACASAMEAPDDRGSGTSLTHAAFVIPATLELAFVPAPPFEARPAVTVAPPPIRVAVLKTFGRLRL